MLKAKYVLPRILLLAALDTASGQPQTPLKAAITPGNPVIAAKSASAAQLPSSERRADFNGDGRADILWENPATGELSVWFMNGTAFAGSAGIGGATTWRVPGTDDFNGDGKPDILWQNPDTGDLVVWFMNGTTQIGQASLAGVTDWRVVGTGDFNGDGKPDILWQQPTSGELWVWYRNGTALTSAASLGGATAWKVVGTGDFNGDGKPDILWQHPTTGELWVWYMNGSTQAGAAALGGATAWKVVGTGDFNGDGKPDILWQILPPGDVWVWFMNGSTVTWAAAINGATTWKALSTYTAGSTPTTPVVTGISPSSGSAGTQVTISGANFGATPGTVTFNGIQVTPTIWGPTTIVLNLPAGVNTGPVVVTVNGFQAAAPTQFVVLPPAITAISLPEGPPQVGLQISGLNFGSSQGISSSVRLSGSSWPAGVSLNVVIGTWTNTSITVQVPIGTPTGAGAVSVVVSGVSRTTTKPFEVIVPFGCNF